ncbi:DUF4192 family protein [Paenarthrobacter ilicis]|uniref:DUF4192 domain-containing protein n=1 Tax=Paenarthrobacter ilicis TaxID=43665 RepID=A0ABX0TMQ2_9MICC|nr:DUF4192 family protein [Paenarthrobacter ilicis]MBM7792955.1 hypothetical protein [Paenarthrobacter ilicis]NIJ03110.1 hypothetical protein [Paenarthrobacter ilicis]
MTSKETLSIHQPEDILGYIPHMLGYWPEDSLVAITMQGKVLGATLRTDLPSNHSRRSHKGFAEQIRNYLVADKEADGVVLALYTDSGWEDGGVVRTMVPLLSELQDCLDRVDLTVKDAWLVGSEYWRSAYCTDSGCCPVPGHSVDRIKHSRLSAEMVYRGRSIGPSPLASAGTAWCRNPGPLDAKVAAAQAKYAAELLDHGRSEGCLDAVLGVWKFVLTERGQRKPLNAAVAEDAGLMGFLRATLTVTAWRDAVVVMAAAGHGSAKSGATAFGMFIEDDGAWSGFDPADLGLPAPALLPADVDADADGNVAVAGPGVSPDVYTYGDVLLGMRPDKPDWASLNGLAEVLTSLCVEDEAGDVAAASLTLRGWISWCKGSGSVAHAQLRRAAVASPGYRLAELLDGVLGQGIICEWALRPDSAWRGNRGVPA